MGREREERGGTSGGREGEGVNGRGGRESERQVGKREREGEKLRVRDRRVREIFIHMTTSVYKREHLYTLENTYIPKPTSVYTRQYLYT